MSYSVIYELARLFTKDCGVLTCSICGPMMRHPVVRVCLSFYGVMRSLAPVGGYWSELVHVGVLWSGFASVDCLGLRRLLSV